MGSPAAAAAVAQQQVGIADAKRAGNADYLARCQPQVAVCPPTNGGITQNYVVGTTLYYNLPTADNAMCTDLLITSNLVINAAVGTSAAYVVNAAAPWSVYDRIIVTYNGTQVQIRPIILKYYWILRGYGVTGSWSVPTGGTYPNVLFSIASLQAVLFATTIQAPGAVLPTGNSTWAWVFRLPLRALHELNPAGTLPIMGQGTKGQVAVICAPALYGNDPILNTGSGTAGTGNAITMNSGTVKVEAIYMDGTTRWSPTPLLLDLVGEPTAQWYFDLPLPNLVAGVINRQAITTLLQHYLVISLLVDGNQSTKFSTYTNIVEIELDKDSVGRNPFYLYGTTISNVSVADFFERIRRYIQQDLDEGVIPWVVAWAENQQTSDLCEGVMVLNMTAGGWTDAHYGVQVSTAGTESTTFGAVPPPRLETFLLSLNPEPLVKQ